ncbi:zinc finger domain-containing protein [Streptomyces mirabilis]|uniref:zinc finger domain-containing protein n=1 Tax=Streptomyces mirabilis TaxID=68239 RepID=UPI003698468E
MTPDDAQKLLAACAAFDNRQPSQIAKRAWATALKDVPLDQDCFDAVARFYGTPPKEAGQRLWIQPHDVRTHRRILREERLENFIYEPPPGESDPNYLQRLRGQQSAIGGGAVAGPSDAPALTGGPHRDVAKALAGIGRQVPDDDEGDVLAQVRRSGPLGIECPKCSAPVGRPCRTPGGKERATHPARKGETSDPAAEQAEMERRKAASDRHFARLGDDEEAAS